MKKVILSLLVCFCVSAVFANDVSKMLDAAKSYYSTGNYNAALQQLDAAKKVIESHVVASGDAVYREVKSWEAVKLKPDSYIDKQVKIKGKLMSVSNMVTTDFCLFCSYEKSMLEKLKELEKHKNYTFFGIVKLDEWKEPYLHIESIK